MLSLLDWESSLFSSKDSTTILKEVDAKIGHPAFTNPASPPSIVVYSAVYALGASPKYLGYLGHPALLNFVVRVSETDHGKKGIKLSNEHTVAEKVDSVAGATTNTTTRGARKLKPGIFASKLEGKKM